MASTVRRAGNSPLPLWERVAAQRRGEGCEVSRPFYVDANAQPPEDHCAYVRDVEPLPFFRGQPVFDVLTWATPSGGSSDGSAWICLLISR